MSTPRFLRLTRASPGSALNPEVFVNLSNVTSVWEYANGQTVIAFINTDDYVTVKEKAEDIVAYLPQECRL